MPFVSNFELVAQNKKCKMHSMTKAEEARLQAAWDSIGDPACNGPLFRVNLRTMTGLMGISASGVESV